MRSLIRITAAAAFTLTAAAAGLVQAGPMQSPQDGNSLAVASTYSSVRDRDRDRGRDRDHDYDRRFNRYRNNYGHHGRHYGNWNSRYNYGNDYRPGGTWYDPYGYNYGPIYNYRNYYRSSPYGYNRWYNQRPGISFGNGRSGFYFSF